MGPFLPSVIGALIAGLLHRRRRCPACGRKQTIPFEKRNQRVRCAGCGASIPPAL